MSQSASISKVDGSRSLHRLSEATKELFTDCVYAAKLATPSDSDTENVESCNPIFDAFVSQQADPEKLLEFLINFTQDAFYQFYGVVQPAARPSLCFCRGHKCHESIQDVFFMLSVTLKQGGKRCFMASMFKNNGSAFEKMMTTFVAAIMSELIEKF